MLENNEKAHFCVIALFDHNKYFSTKIKYLCQLEAEI